MKALLKPLLILFAITARLAAVVPPATAWETRPGLGSSSNGSGFTWFVGTSTAYNDVYTDTSNPAYICSAALKTFSSADVGKTLKATTGVGALDGGYQIVGTVTVSNTNCTGGATAGVQLDRPIAGVNEGALTISLYPGVDHSQQTAAWANIDNSHITATVTTTTITFTGGSTPYTPSTADDGNFVDILSSSGGTASPTLKRYSIASVGASTWVLDSSTGAAGASITSALMGGAADIPDSVIGAAVSQNKIFVKQTGTAWSTGGFTASLVDSPSSAVPYLEIIGYKTSREDGALAANCGNCVDVQPSGTGQTAVTLSGIGIRFRNFYLDGSGSYTLGTCLSATGTFTTSQNVKCGNYTTNGIIFSAADNQLLDSEVTAGLDDYLLSASYVSGGTISGTGTCTLGTFNGGGTGATANIAVSSGVAGAITVTAQGSGYSVPPTTATIASGGGATCTGTVTITSVAGACAAGVSWAATGDSFLRNNIHGNACNFAMEATTTGASLTHILWNQLTNNGFNTGLQFEFGSDIEHNTIDAEAIGIVGNSSGSPRNTTVKNNLFTNITTVAIEPWTAGGWGFFAAEDGNCFYGNAANFTNANDEGITTAANGIWPLRGTLDQILSSSPYVDITHAGGNYAITTSTGAYQGGTPGALPGTTQIGYASCGAVVPQAPAGGSAGGSAYAQ